MKVACSYTELVDIAKLVSNPKNANQHSQQQIKLLAKLMDFQGWRHPIIVSKLSGFIVAGHARLDAAIINSWKQAPVDYQDFESEAQEYAFLISDNKIAELSDTDLGMINLEISEFGPEFDMELLGIPDFKIDIADLPQLQSGDKLPYQQVTFTLHDDQKCELDRAMELAKSMGDFVDTQNDNRNGNTLARICEMFLGQNGNG